MSWMRRMKGALAVAAGLSLAGIVGCEPEQGLREQEEEQQEQQIERERQPEVEIERERQPGQQPPPRETQPDGTPEETTPR